MRSELKKKLLQRKFSSIEYMEEFREHHAQALSDMEEAIQWFFGHPPSENWHHWDRSEWPETWRERAVGNFQGMQAYLKDAVELARDGDPSYMESAAAEFTGIGKDMEGLGWRWWDYVPDEYRERFIKHRRAAMDRASNIWETVGDYWDDSDDLLDEEVTGPVDEQDLLRYLEPGESP